MEFTDGFKQNIFNINEESFESICLELFNYQFRACEVYHSYCSFLGKDPTNVQSIQQIPFLPISFFKNHAVKSGHWKEVKVFKSSGTTTTGRSHHYVRDLSFYQKVAKKGFESHYGALSDYQILALLPSYLEQGDSSLIQMVDFFMSEAQPDSVYLLNKPEEFAKMSNQNEQRKLLIGVSYALLDMSEKQSGELRNVIIMETGGMKGRRKELTRNELHHHLKSAFNQESIHSEYGMTELMSQAYGEKGVFQFPKWAKVLIRDINDPFSYLEEGKTGGINVIDLANVDSCSFLETKDLGKVTGERFEVLGRFDNSDVRGCNLMI